jgi:Domain of unknown function (DUF397)
MADVSSARWRKSTFSMGNGDCLEVARLEAGDIAIRDSKDQAGLVLTQPLSEWQAFVAGVKRGEFDIQC